MTKESDIVAREGHVILAVSCVVTVLLCLWHLLAGLPGVLWVLFCIYFFRNPSRIRAYEPGQMVAPADGRVIFVGEAVENHFLKTNMQKISIFMSPFNVHVNRAPVTGVVRHHLYCPGSFLAAFDQRAGDHNERSAILLADEGAHEIVFVQVAGWFARRIVTYSKTNDAITQGNIIGMIRFGSRMDIYFSEAYQPQVTLDQKVKAGATVIAVKKM